VSEIEIALLDYGMGNLHSVGRALARAGGRPTVTTDPDGAGRARALVIPGVGAFGACMRALAGRGLDDAIVTYATSGRPVFGICLGMQVLFEGSEEDPEPGLGVLSGWVRRLPDDVRVPHMGWNTLTSVGSHPYLDGIPDGTRFYFVHSYAPDPDVRSTVAVTDHGRPFASVVAHDNVFATQFHPEKSSHAGLQIYASFVKAVGAA
jgi:glutamine amidotransferase